MDHPDGDATELDPCLVRRSPIPNVERVAVACNHRERSESRHLIEQRRLDDISRVQDVIGAFEIGPRPLWYETGSPTRVRVGDDRDLQEATRSFDPISSGAATVSPQVGHLGSRRALT